MERAEARTGNSSGTTEGNDCESEQVQHLLYQHPTFPANVTEIAIPELDLTVAAEAAPQKTDISGPAIFIRDRRRRWHMCDKYLQH